MRHVLSHIKEENFKAESTQHVSEDLFEKTITGSDVFENRFDFIVT